MKRLYLTVEGQTEAAFASRVLTPHLAELQCLPLSSTFHGLASPSSWSNSPRRASAHVWTCFGRYADVAQGRSVVGRSFFDDGRSLFAPKRLSGICGRNGQATGREQANALQQSLATEVGDTRFIPYLQVHEYEALVLVDPRRIASIYEVADAQIEALCQECSAYPTPEQINDGQHSHPKYRIQQRVSDYDENVAGPLLAEDIGLPTLRERCPHFGEWLTRLEQLDAGGA